MIPIEHIEVKTAAGKCAAFLSPKTDGLKECFSDTRLNGESTLEFLIPANSEKIVELTPECQIWTTERVYTLLKDEAVDTIRDKKNTLWSKFMAAERWAELDSEYPEPYITNDPLIPSPSDLAVIIVGGGSDLSGGLYAVGSAAHALYAVLDGSEWSIGTVDITGTHDLEMEKVSRLQLIKEIQNIWGGYLVWNSVNRTVSLRSENIWQNYTGFQIRYKKNLQHITRTQSNRLVTKLYPFGHEDLDIASVNGGVKYLTNNAFSPYEYIGIYKNQDIYNAQELKDKATAELALICRPRYRYSVKMVDLRTLPEYSHEDFTVGDMADVIDPDAAPDSPHIRIIRHKYNLFQPWKCDIELGDPQERFQEKIKAAFDTTGFVDTKFKGNGQISGYYIEDLTIEDAKIKNLSAEKIKADTVLVNIRMSVGSGDNIFKVDSNGIYLGDATFANAPFSVDMAGSLIAENATILGTFKTAQSGARIELTDNGIKSYITGTTEQGFFCEPSSIYAKFGMKYAGSELYSVNRLNDGSVSMETHNHWLLLSDGYNAWAYQDWTFEQDVQFNNDVLGVGTQLSYNSSTGVLKLLDSQGNELDSVTI
ncbi:MAG TPA: phage tail spike protein [Clostridia bacterium]|nr:phage tail spike protein [Clostridia bacterium]